MTILYILIGLVVLIGLWFVLSYNKLAQGRMKVENSWGQINVQLKMRADLVPNVVETVKGYAKHEQETFTKVMEARNRYMSADTPTEAMASSGEISGLVGRLFAVAEQYPDLKANSNFLDLQVQVKEIEAKIAMYRQFYNDTVLKYNKEVVRFPKNIAASILGFKELPYFQIEEGDRRSPKIAF